MGARLGGAGPGPGVIGAGRPDQWMGEVAVAVVTDARGRAAYPTLRSSGALAVRVSGGDAWIVGAGAHPIGGDRLRIALDVGRHAHLTVRSTSATLARASVPPRPSRLEVDAAVDDGGSLRWAPAPGVAAQGSCHHTASRISLAAKARLSWVESVVLGRAAEAPGSWSNFMRVDVGGHPLLVNELALGPAHPAWSSSSVLSGARAATTVLVVDPDRRAPETTLLDEVTGYLVAVGEHAFGAVVWGTSMAECHRGVAALCEAAQVSRWPGADAKALLIAA